MVKVTRSYLLSLSPPFQTRDPLRSQRFAQQDDIRALRGRWIAWLPPTSSDFTQIEVRLESGGAFVPGQLPAEREARPHGATSSPPAGFAPDTSPLFVAYVARGVTALIVEGSPATLNRLASVTLSVSETPPETASIAWRRVARLEALQFVGTIGLRPLDDVTGFVCQGGDAAWVATLPTIGRWQLQARFGARLNGHTPQPVTVEVMRSDGSVRHLGAPTTKEEVTLTVEVHPEDLLLRLTLDHAALGTCLSVEALDWQPPTPPAASHTGYAAWRRLRRWSRWHLGPGALLPSPLPMFNGSALAAAAILRFALEPGWYLLRLEAQGCAESGYLHLLGLDGSAEICHVPERPRRIPVRPGRWTKRLLRVTRSSLLAFVPPAGSPMPDLRALSLTRIPATFVRSRIVRKLLAAHPGYSARGAATLGEQPLDDLWSAYEAVFDRNPAALIGYREWIERAEAAPAAESCSPRPHWGIALLDRGHGASGAVRASLESVYGQTHRDWRLELLARVPIDDVDSRVSWRPVQEPAALGSALCAACRRTDVDTWLLLTAGDQLAPDALVALGRCLSLSSTALVAYSDDDRLAPDGTREDPDFKPEASPDLLLGRDYVSTCMAWDAALLRHALSMGPLEDAAEAYDLALRASELAPTMAHVPRVLCHRAARTTDHGHDEAAARAVTAALRRRGLGAAGARVETIAPGLRRVHWPRPSPAPLVSLIVPTRDSLEVLRTCVESILTRTHYAPFELIVVDNQSIEPATQAYLAGLARDARVRVLPYHRPFNYAAINNEAVVQARGSILGLVNNDIEVIGPDWLDEMVSLAVRPEIGCVGAKLLYPDDRVQHAGVFVGLSGLADHAGRGLPRAAPGPQRRHWLAQEVSAVTGAVMVLRREVFDAVGGLDAEGLPVAFNDVDLCLKVLRAGWRNLWTPHAELYHHESYSRGADVTEAQRTRFRGELGVMRSRWADVIARDPYHPPAYARIGDGYGLSVGKGERGAAA